MWLANWFIIGKGWTYDSKFLGDGLNPVLSNVFFLSATMLKQVRYIINYVLLADKDE